MYKLYFKQAWQLLRQEKLFSAIYILGTGLSISMVMVLAIVFYIKMADIYPETNRHRMLIVKCAQVRQSSDNAGFSALSLPMAETCLGQLKKAEAVSLVYGDRDNCFVQLEGSPEQLGVSVRYVDEAFWQVFPFTFLSGKPFTEADQQSGLRTVVMAASLATRLFGTTEVMGREVSLDFKRYRIAGVVKDASFAADKTYALLWMPYTAVEGLETVWEADLYGGALGPFKAYVLCPSAGEIESVKAEAEENIARYASTLGELKLTVNGQPDRQWQTVFRHYGGEDIDWTRLLIRYALIFLILLLIPAVSLSGMTDSRMERRLSEMGVRRAFGAPMGSLMKQVISENLLFTLLGGGVGLGFSYLLVLRCSNWILYILQQSVDVLPEGVRVVFSPSMLMNYTVFSIAFVVCLVLNLASAVIPAWRASHREVIYSLNIK